jgi:hypothetical protein
MNKSPKLNIIDAENELSRVFGTTWKLLTKLMSFRKIVSSGLPFGAEQHEKVTREQLKKYSKIGEYNHWFKDGYSWDYFFQKIDSDPDYFRYKKIESNQRIVDAACIVFAHGILDDSVNGYLKVTSIALPSLWDSYLENKKVELKNIREMTYDKIREENLKRLFDKEIEQLSFPKKLELLHEISKVKEGETFLDNNFAFEKKRLWIFHEIKNKIVHGVDWDSHSFDFNTENDYWFVLNAYLASLVCEKTGIKISTKVAGQYLF